MSPIVLPAVVAAVGDDGTGPPGWLPWLVLVGVVAVGLWMVSSMVRHRGRDAAVARAAAAAGMRYQQQDGPGLGRLQFSLLRAGGVDWAASNVVARGRDGDAVYAFDVMLRRIVEGDGAPVLGVPVEGGARRVERRIGSGAVVTLPINVPRVMIVRENRASKLFTTLTRLDLDVESDAFNTGHHVLTERTEAARELLGSRVLDLIVSGEGRLEFEFVGNRLLVLAPLLEPELLPGLAAYAARFRDAIDQLTLDHYPDGSRLDP